MNTVNLIGHLARDPERVETNGDAKVTVLRIAVSRPTPDGALLADVKTFGRQAEVCADHLTKGRQIGVTGRLELAEWTDEGGGKRSRLYVIGERVDFLGRSRSEEEGNGNGNGNGNGSGYERSNGGERSSGNGRSGGGRSTSGSGSRRGKRD